MVDLDGIVERKAREGSRLLDVLGVSAKRIGVDKEIACGNELTESLPRIFSQERQPEKLGKARKIVLGASPHEPVGLLACLVLADLPLGRDLDLRNVLKARLCRRDQGDDQEFWEMSEREAANGCSNAVGVAISGADEARPVDQPLQPVVRLWILEPTEVLKDGDGELEDCMSLLDLSDSPANAGARFVLEMPESQRCLP